MSSRLSPARLLVSIALMVSMPLCCCSFRSLARCCSPIVEREVPANTHADAEGAETEHAHCGGGHDHGGAGAGTDPCGPDSHDNHDDGDQCACGKHLTKMGVVGKPNVEIPAPALVAILPLPPVPSWSAEPSQLARISAARPLVPLATSLLRLHCALTV